MNQRDNQWAKYIFLFLVICFFVVSGVFPLCRTESGVRVDMEKEWNGVEGLGASALEAGGEFEVSEWGSGHWWRGLIIHTPWPAC